jgi:hypothetical protein
MAKKPKIASEAALAEVVTTWLRADGWRTYHEVELPRSGRADIVAVRRGLVWIVETKLQAGLEVLDQALDRQRAGAHGVVVAVPGGPAALRLAAIAGRLGVGVLAVEEGTYYDGRLRTPQTGLHPVLKVWPDFARKARVAELTRLLRPEYERQAAGTTGAMVRWTPFKAAVKSVVEALLAAPGHRLLVDQLALDEAVREYKRGFVAAQLWRWLCWAVDEGLVPGCTLDGRGKTRAAVLDPAKLTAARRRDLQLDT